MTVIAFIFTWVFLKWALHFLVKHREEIDTLKAKVQHLESKLTP
jgi:hypothetical protein